MQNEEGNDMRDGRVAQAIRVVTQETWYGIKDLLGADGCFLCLLTCLNGLGTASKTQ